MEEQKNELIEQTPGEAPEETPVQTPSGPNMRTRYIIRILVGGYLAYLGAQLIKSYVKDGPAAGLVAIIAGPAFVLIGAALVVWSVVLMTRDDT